MLGGSVAVPDAAIRELCLKAPVITSQDELGQILSLRPEYHHRLFLCYVGCYSMCSSSEEEKSIICVTVYIICIIKLIL